MNPCSEAIRLRELLSSAGDSSALTTKVPAPCRGLGHRPRIANGSRLSKWDDLLRATSPSLAPEVSGHQIATRHDGSCFVAERALTLGEVGLYDAHAGVGKVQDVDVVVAEAAKLVGKKVKVRIAAVTEGRAWAELLVPVVEVREPLTAESEAEKPTRAKRSATARKPDQPAAEVDVEGDVPVGDEFEPEEAAVAEVEEVALDPGTGEPLPPKKRTRRGSRGGRNRKKKPAAGSADGAAEEAPAPEVPAAGVADTDVEEVEKETPGPVIHVPERDLGEASENGDAPAAPKKRTRRGSRGGKNRRKKPVVEGTALEVDEPSANGAEATEAPEMSDTDVSDTDEQTLAPEIELEPEPEEPEAEPQPAGDWGYTPMSEWGMDER